MSASALDRLPDQALGVPELDAYPAWRLAAAFLVGFRGHTRRAYFNDIRAWYARCASAGVHPFAAQRHDVDRWIAEQTEAPQPKTGKPAAAATVPRRLSCLAGLISAGAPHRCPMHTAIGNIGVSLPDRLPTRRDSTFSRRRPSRWARPGRGSPAQRRRQPSETPL